MANDCKEAFKPENIAKIEKMMGQYSEDAANSEDPAADAEEATEHVLFNGPSIIGKIVDLVDAIENLDWFDIG